MIGAEPAPKLSDRSSLKRVTSGAEGYAWKKPMRPPNFVSIRLDDASLGGPVAAEQDRISKPD